MIASRIQDSQYTRSLIEASLDPLVTINIEGKVTDVNEASIKVTGVSRENLIGTNFSDYFTEPKKAQEGYLQVFEKGFVSNYPLTIKHINGSLTDVSYNASVYKDEKGKVIGVFAAARDVTEHKWAKKLRIANKELLFQNAEKEKRAAELVIANKELIFQNEEKEKRAAELVIANKELAFQIKEKEKRDKELAIADLELVYQTNETQKQEIVNKELKALSYAAKSASQYSLSLIEASLDPLVTISPEGKITDMNEATVNITGMTRKELTGTDFFEYFTEPKNAREVYKEVFANGSVTDSPLTIRHKNGKLTDVLFNGSVYKDDNDNVLGVVIVARDVTEQRRISSDLTEAMVFAEMAAVIAQEAKGKAEKSTQVAEEALKAKQQFLSNMSHEIRTPMNAIIGFTKVMMKTELSKKQREYLSAIKLSGDALIVLIDDILDLAKVDAGKMTFEQIPFKLKLSILAMLHLFESKIQEKNLKFVKEYDSNIPRVLVGDPVRLHQIIMNLLSNAVKFTLKGKITVSVKLLKEDENTVTIEFAVSDTGIGITDAQLEKIFDNFQQAASGTARLYGGTGLGLAIVKQLVEAQGGDIKVESKFNSGSTFSFRLNFQKTKAAAELDSEVVKLSEEITNARVLVAEDMPLNQLLMRTLLEEFEFECDIAVNGKIALEKMQHNIYDIILMDLQMPEMNGFEVTEYIRNTLKSDIPIIALTADVTTVDLAKCRAVGMNDYIAKPVDERILYSKMVGLIKKIPNVQISNEIESEATAGVYDRKDSCIDLNYLFKRAKSNPILIMEMISLYLKQIPLLITAMKESYKDKDWDLLYATVHKMIPSFSIIGINPDFEEMARKVQDYASTQKRSEGIADMVIQLENICGQACKELEVEFNGIKTQKDERK